MSLEATQTTMRRRSGTWSWWWVVAAVVLLVGGGIRYRVTHAESKLRFDTVPADRGHISAKVTASGTLSALVTVQVGAQVSGRVQQIFVDYNAPVRKGQVVAKLDPQLYEASLQQAKANDLAAQASLKKSQVQAADANRQYQRNQSLAGEKLVSQADLETSMANAQAAQAQVDASQGALEQAQASLYQAQVNLDYTTITSPIDGVVVSRQVDVGQTVVSAFQTPTLFTIAQDLREMQVDTNVSEADIGKLRPGMPATFTVDAYPGDHFSGTVRQIRHAPQTVQNIVTYDAVLDVKNADLRLEPGMTANVTFVHAERDKALRMPNAALRFRPGADALTTLRAQGKALEDAPHDRAINQRRVWVLHDKIPQEVEVTTGVSDGSFSEIVAGEIQEGDALIVDFTDLGAKPRFF